MSATRSQLIARTILGAVVASIVGFLVWEHVTTAARLAAPHRIVYTDDKYRPVAEAAPVFPNKASCEEALSNPTDHGLPKLLSTPYFAAGCAPDKRPYPNEVKK